MRNYSPTKKISLRRLLAGIILVGTISSVYILVFHQNEPTKIISKAGKMTENSTLHKRMDHIDELLEESLKHHENTMNVLKDQHKEIINKVVKASAEKLNPGAAVSATSVERQKTMSISESNPHVVLGDVRVNLETTYKFIVLVSSHSSHFKRRDRIRKAWGNSAMWVTKHKFKVIFSLGHTTDKYRFEMIKKESKTFGDIMSEDVKEDYFKLSFKVMIGLKWAYESFKFDFIFKTDDDIFVQVDRVMARFDTDFAHQHFIGNAMIGQPVRRNVVSKEMHKNDAHDPYCSGGGYILSREAIKKIMPLFDWDKPLIIDDAYIGQLVYKAGIKVYHVEKSFMMWNDRCHYSDLLLVSHPVKKIECMEFLTAHSLIENGKLVNDAIKQTKYGVILPTKAPPKPPPTTKSPPKTIAKVTLKTSLTDKATPAKLPARLEESIKAPPTDKAVVKTRK